MSGPISRRTAGLERDQASIVLPSPPDNESPLSPIPSVSSPAAWVSLDRPTVYALPDRLSSQSGDIAPILGSWYSGPVRIIAKRILRNFWVRHPKAKGPLEAWHQEVAAADWASPSAVKTHFRSASLLQDRRVVFNIAGNQYRLIVKINYAYRIVYIRFVGTHADYDAIDARTI